MDRNFLSDSIQIDPNGIRCRVASLRFSCLVLISQASPSSQVSRQVSPPSDAPPSQVSRQVLRQASQASSQVSQASQASSFSQVSQASSQVHRQSLPGVIIQTRNHQSPSQSAN